MAVAVLTNVGFGIEVIGLAVKIAKIRFVWLHHNLEIALVAA